MEFLIAHLVFELRFPIPFVVHVLIHRALSKEVSIACVAFVSWGPVVKRVHMLYGSLLVTKVAIARLAFIVIVHIEVVLPGLVCFSWN